MSTDLVSRNRNSTALHPFLEFAVHAKVYGKVCLGFLSILSRPRFSHRQQPIHVSWNGATEAVALGTTRRKEFG
jgi:hypothetical protein